MNRPKYDDEWPTARLDAYMRDGGCCIICGKPATEVNHRRPRGMGGNRNDPDRHRADRLATTCRPCHQHYETHDRAEGTRLGFFVPAGMNPEKWPIKHRNMGWILLNRDGTKTPTDADPTQTATPNG